jgi:phage shock protein E
MRRLDVIGRGGWVVAAVVLALLHAPAAVAANPATEGRTVAVEGGGRYTDVGPAVLARMLARQDVTLINVHVPYQGEIEGTDLFVPFDRVGAHADRLPADRSARLVVYCLSGRMSTLAVGELVARGYTDVWHLAGGMIAWGRAGYPLVATPR